jgi:DNA-binding NarL/FixJ family response regulator
LRKVLDATPDLEVVAEAEDGAEAVVKALEEDVHLAILDVSMPRMTGIQAAAELHKRKPEIRVLMPSMHDSKQFLLEALKAGASGYVLKSEADTDIVDACHASMRGDSLPASLDGHGARPRLHRARRAPAKSSSTSSRRVSSK